MAIYNKKAPARLVKKYSFTNKSLNTTQPVQMTVTSRYMISSEILNIIIV